MHPNEFDKALRDRFDSGSLPPDLAQWEQLVSRLDEYESAAVPPARKPRRGIVALWPVWTVAASILLIGWLFLQRTQPLPTANKNRPSSKSVPAIPQRPALATTSTEREAAAPDRSETPRQSTLPGTSPKLIATAKSGRGDQKPVSTNRIVPTSGTQVPVTAQPSVQRPEPIAATQAPRSSESPLPKTVVDAAPQGPRNTEPQRPQVNLAQAVADDGYMPEEQERRRLSVDVNGGYGPGSLKRNYALGVSVNRKITERIRVEAGLAVVSGTYQSFNTAASNAFRPGVEMVPENTNNRLTYIQAAPGVTYELRPGLFAGAGVDAQRLLTDAGDAKGYSYSGEELEAQPAWDFGYTVRAVYKLNRHIKAGLQYRNSMHGTAPVSGTNVQPRNYLLFQLGYTIH